MRTSGPRADLERLYAAYGPRCVPPEEGVRLVFHTYHGFLLWVVQTKHRFYLPADVARELLWELHCFNLRWGFFAYLGFLVPLLSYANYRIQKRSITRQERKAYESQVDAAVFPAPADEYSAVARKEGPTRSRSNPLARCAKIGVAVGLLVAVGSCIAMLGEGKTNVKGLLAVGIMCPVLGFLIGVFIGWVIDFGRELFGGG